MQIKTTMRCHFTPMRMAPIRKIENEKCWLGYGEIETLVHCWWECKWCSHYGKQYGSSSKKLKIELPYDPAILLLDIYPERMESRDSDICTPMFIAALFTIAKRWKQPKCPSTNEWICKIWSIHTMESYSALERKEMLTPATTWMSLKDIMLCEISQSQKDKYCMTSLVWSMQSSKIMETESKMVISRGWEVRGWELFKG